MSKYYIGGFITGFIIVAIFSFIMSIRKNSKNIYDYDERQIAARGKAFKLGFFTIMIANLANGVIVEWFDNVWGTQFTMNFVCAALGIAVFVVHSIFHDAYMSFKETPFKLVVLFTFIIVINAISGVHNIVENEAFTKDGRLSEINIACAVLFAIITIAIIIKSYVLPEYTEDEEC